MYSMGDCVVYHHDVCKVVGYEENYIEEDDYLVLEAIFQHSLQYYVPVRSLDLLLRPVISKEQALQLIDSIKDTEPLCDEELKKYNRKRNLPGQGSASSNNKLHDCYRNYLKKNTIDNLIPFIKRIHLRMEEREDNDQNPIATDKEFYKIVEEILQNELAVALDMQPDEVREFIENRTGLHFYEKPDKAEKPVEKVGKAEK